MRADTPTLAQARALLGLHGSNSPEQAAAAFRAAVKAARPDQPGGDDQRFRQIIAAWGVLQAAGLQPDTVVGPAMGGVVIGYELARQLGVPGIFTERDADGQMTLRRGFAVTPGEKIIIAEDVVTTGKSTLEAAKVLRAMGAEVLAVASLIDRTGGNGGLDFPHFALLSVQAATFAPENCPLCAAGVPVVKPGSRPEKAF